MANLTTGQPPRITENDARRARTGENRQDCRCPRSKGPLRTNRNAVTEKIILDAIHAVNPYEISRFYFGLPARHDRHKNIVVCACARDAIEVPVVTNTKAARTARRQQL